MTIERHGRWFVECTTCRDGTELSGSEERNEEAAAFERRHGHEVSKESPRVTRGKVFTV